MCKIVCYCLNKLLNDHFFSEFPKKIIKSELPKIKEDEDIESECKKVWRKMEKPYGSQLDEDYKIYLKRKNSVVKKVEIKQPKENKIKKRNEYKYVFPDVVNSVHDLEYTHNGNLIHSSVSFISIVKGDRVYYNFGVFKGRMMGVVNEEGNYIINFDGINFPGEVVIFFIQNGCYPWDS